MHRNFLKFRLGMTDDTGPLQYASHSWIHGRMTFNCIGQCTTHSFISRNQSCGPRRVALQQSFNDPPTCSAVSLLSSLSSSQASASKTPFTETPLVEVCSAKVRPRYFALHQNFAWGTWHHLSGSLLSDLNVERGVTAIWRPRALLAFRVLDRHPIFPIQELSRRSPHVL